jgi:mRNA interferase MazF
MRRGDIWTVAGGKDYAGKPRPVVIVQDDSFDATDSITICAFTTDETDAPLFRLPVQPNERNGLRAACRLMVDKISTVPKTKVGARVGRLDDEDILRLNQAVLVFLGLAVSPRTKQEAWWAMVQSVGTARIGPFHFLSARAILPQCPGTAPLCATAPRSANCLPISMSCPAPGRALADRSNTTLRHGASWTTGPRACRSRISKSTSSKHGSATCSTSCSGRRDDVRSLPT